MDFSTKLLTLFLCVAQIYCDCNVCQGTNNVACHSENTFSLCINGKPTEDYITCPENYVCTLDSLVCYPLPEATPSCISEQTLDVNFCGVCSENKVYACLNETTIAFCMGNDVPIEGAVSYCPENTVCDITGRQGFCTDDMLAKPSCVSDSNGNEPGEETPTTMEPTTTTTTIVPTTTTTEPTTITETTTETEPPTTSTTTEPTTTTTTTEPTTTTTTTEPTTTTATTNPTTTTTTTEPTTTTATTEPTTTTTTTEPTTTTTTTEPTIFDADVYCKNLATTGSYPLASDETCTKFVYCYTYGTEGVVYGLMKSCPSGNYFNKDTKLCTAAKPEGCI